MEACMGGVRLVRGAKKIGDQEGGVTWIPICEGCGEIHGERMFTSPVAGAGTRRYTSSFWCPTCGHKQEVEVIAWDSD